MRRTTRNLLFVASIALATSAVAANTVFNAVATTSLGDFEGGALHIALVTDDDELVIYADNLMDDGPWVGRTGDGDHRLVVMSCDVSISKCEQVRDAALTIDFKRFSRIEARLVYTNLEGDKRDIRFRAKLR